MTAAPDIIWDGVTLVITDRWCDCGHDILHVRVVGSRRFETSMASFHVRQALRRCKRKKDEQLAERVAAAAQ